MTGGEPSDERLASMFIAAVRARDPAAMDEILSRLQASGEGLDVWALVRDADRRGRTRTTNPLSEREIEIMEFIAAGMNNREIGVRLHLSPYTVKSYVDRVFLKLAVKKRSSAVVVAVSNGWIQAPARPSQDRPLQQDQAPDLIVPEETVNDLTRNDEGEQYA